MSNEYTIVKVHNNPVLTGGGIEGLEGVVNELMRNGWHAVGGPFFEPGQGRWCQALERTPNAPAGEVALREPQAPPLPPVAPGNVHVHGSPTDKPLQMREPKRGK